jgi:hypothetical protein
MPQLQLTFEIHRFENNPVSQRFLDDHREDYAFDAWKLLLRLLTGEKMTNREVISLNISNSPTRRWCDLEEFGINISKQEIQVPYSSRKVMQYWIEPSEIARVYQMIVAKIKFTKKKAT